MSIFNFKCKIINQSVVINGSDITDTSDKVWIVQNGKYLTYPKIDHEQTWNFYLILSIIDFKCKILDQNATINGREMKVSGSKMAPRQGVLGSNHRNT